MTPKEKEEELITKFKIILIIEDTECGNEILCTIIARQSALIAVDEILSAHLFDLDEKEYWQQVKTEIENL